MIQSSKIVNKIREALLSIPELVSCLSHEDRRIQAFHYQFAENSPLSQAVESAPSPSILIAVDSIQGGNFNGTTVRKYKVAFYIRGGNSESNPAWLNPYDMWVLMMGRPVLGGTQNLRNSRLLPNLEVAEEPSLAHRVDSGRTDYFVGVMVLDELGDDWADIDPVEF